VADFLGETNFLPASIQSISNGVAILDTPAGTLRSSAISQSTPTGGNVTVSIRPEAWRLVRPQPAAANSQPINHLKGRVHGAIYLGEICQHMIELVDGTTVRTIELNPSLPALSSGEIQVAVDPADVVVLID
jgi:spermidine/putrescine transport system ATP-binding protein